MPEDVAGIFKGIEMYAPGLPLYTGGLVNKKDYKAVGIEGGPLVMGEFTEESPIITFLPFPMSDVSKPLPSNPQAIAPPPGVPQPTGHLRTDVYNSVTNILQIPCAKNAFMQGLVSGVGVGFIRGTTAAPIVAGHWAITTFVGISGVSWYICHRRMAKEREKVIQMIESTPKRTVKHEEST